MPLAGRIGEVCCPDGYDQAKILRGKWLIIIEHTIDHTLSTQSTQHPEETRLAEMHPVVLAVMLRAISPLGFKLTVLKAIAGNTRARSAHVADHIFNNIDQCLRLNLHTHLSITFQAATAGYGFMLTGIL